jgi:antitoxin (DNA-binding transcriptional repressor) of toxin-antitoxin stability system
MKVATVRDLRLNFSLIEAWLQEGEEVRIEKRGKPLAMLKPIAKASKPKVKNPDFEARRKAIWGDRFFSEDEVAEMRAYELEGEEG